MKRSVTMSDELVRDEVKSNVVNLPFKGVIFDMDGTLIESTQADYLAWQKTFADFGRALSFADYQPLLGIKSADVIKRVLGVVDEDEVKECLATKLKYFREIVSVTPIQPVPGAEKLLQQVKEMPVKMALATSSRSEKMKLVMTSLNFINYFDELVTGEEVVRSKPAPDIFILAAKKLGLDVSECVVIEDAVNGVKAAKAANMKCIAITTTHKEADLFEADAVIDSFDEIDFTALLMQLA